MRDKGRCFSLIVEHLDIGGSRSAYATLDLKEGASMSEVRSAFREKARLWHPDKCAKPECAKKFRVRSQLDRETDENERGTVHSGMPALLCFLHCNLQSALLPVVFFRQQELRDAYERIQKERR